MSVSVLFKIIANSVPAILILGSLFFAYTCGSSANAEFFCRTWWLFFLAGVGLQGAWLYFKFK